MFGLKEEELSSIIDVIKSYSEIKEAIIFGSRALNSHKKGSDIDIVLKGDEVESIITSINGKLNEESKLPYFFDILDYHSIRNEELKEHIDRVGQVIYNTKK